jgi:predicted NAD/FAD-binding protein
MSFSVQHRSRDLEYCGSSLNHLFAQSRNLLNPSFYRMLWQIDRFNREAKTALDDYVHHGSYGQDFFNLYLIPMSSAVWSTPPEKMRRFPVVTLLRFFHNHGFLGLYSQHAWWTVVGGAKTYVEKRIAPFRKRIHLRTPVLHVRRLSEGGIEVTTATASARFDKVVFACHAPTSFEILGDDATPDEHRLLSVFQYQPNVVTLHTDESIMPSTYLARSA